MGKVRLAQEYPLYGHANSMSRHALAAIPDLTEQCTVLDFKDYERAALERFRGGQANTAFSHIFQTKRQPLFRAA